MEGIKHLLMKAKSLPAVDPSRLYTRQEVATMFLPLQTSNYSAMSVVLKSWNMKLVKIRLILVSVGASLFASSPKPISYAKMDARL